MKLSRAVKPISYIKSHASEIVRELENNRESIVVTLNGEAKAVLQDIHEYEKTQESLAMLKILAIGRKEIEKGKYQPIDEAFDEVRKIVKENRK
jgi:prevent-host-death family protein